MEIIKTRRRSREAVARMQKIFWSKLRPDIVTRYRQYKERQKYRPDWWYEWYDYGFFWGYDWQTEFDYSEIEDYFWNPVIAYYFSEGWNEEMFQEWFETPSASELFYRQPFKYTGVIIPTDTIEDLLMSVSAMPIPTQAQFRNALENILGILERTLAQKFGKNFRFKMYDIGVDHFRLEEDVAIVLEGMAGKGPDQYPFKAFLDLKDPSKSMAVIVTRGVSSESPKLIQELLQMNQRVESAFGNDGRTR